MIKKILILTKNNSFLKEQLKRLEENEEVNIFSSLYDGFFLDLNQYDKIVIENDSFDLTEFNYILKLFSDFILLNEEKDIINLIKKTYSYATSEEKDIYFKKIIYMLSFLPNTELKFVVDENNKKEKIENLIKQNFIKI